ncbi:hypothetical protein COO60DRAFT_1126529 [Scenedesmus sp. NREL 46B-D3]|nr:hypothetical protein COO60DRAFT_1126529 [Scenedesmus sp. NREL 46B-D3]
MWKEPMLHATWRHERAVPAAAVVLHTLPYGAAGARPCTCGARTLCGAGSVTMTKELWPVVAAGYVYFRFYLVGCFNAVKQTHICSVEVAALCCCCALLLVVTFQP